MATSAERFRALRVARTAVEQILALLPVHDAVGLFPLAQGVHAETVVEMYRDLFDGVIELDEEDTITASFA